MHLRFMQLIFGISHRPFPRQRIVGTCLWIKPIRHWYLTSELISYRSRVFPKERAFSTTGGWLQATVNQTRQRHLIRNFTGTMGFHFYLKKILKSGFFVCLFFTCALLAGESEVVVARNIIPLTILMPYHHHTVLASREEAVRLVGPPVFILLK